ncbi:hypothetical protein Ahy_B08g089228 isoform B [Arachis hypogaea]|uniref:Uncharacterized protein n=1 Tax=Arachis hypogaea TaxID=3818 RepID=A0A444XX20_ARAHY|nr:hypothetical protein Ahy_B08g089228 isoform B [Arachis hypogaea]
MEGLASWCTCTMKVLFFSGEAAASVVVTVRMKESRVWQGAIGAAVETEWEVMLPRIALNDKQLTLDPPSQ